MATQTEQLSREQLLLEIERLRQEVADLKRDKSDLEILLETTTEHSDTVEAELHHKAQEAVKESERRLAQFLEAVPVGVFVVDAKGKPYYANQTAQQILSQGIAPEATPFALSGIYQTYLAGTDRLYPSDRRPIARALKGESGTVDDIELRQGDKIIPLEMWATPIFDEKGEVVYAIAAFQDITERKRSEAERTKFTSELFQLNQALSRFVPRQFLQLLNKESIVDVQLGDQVQQEMSVLFADIRNFTTLSESLTPQENFRFINNFLSRMEPAIIESQGFIDKYIGDGIMALFSGGADDAVKAGISMLQRLSNYNQQRERNGDAPIQIGIGINTGSLMLGTVGGSSRMDSTVISDTVNLASRLEELTKNYGVSLLISHHTFLQLQNANHYAFRIIARVKVKGKSAPVSIYEIFDADLPSLKEGKLATKGQFEQALLFYNQNAITEAAQLFKDCLRLNPMDKVAQIYLDRCQLKQDSFLQPSPIKSTASDRGINWMTL
jgi:PAS domain S-box-containing protein